MRKAQRTKALYAGSFDPVTRGHLDIIRKALTTFDAVHVTIGTNVRKQRTFSVEDSLRLIKASVVELWPQANALFDDVLEIGEYANQSLIKYARTIGATHIVRRLREAANFNEEFNLHGCLNASIPRSRWFTSFAMRNSSTSPQALRRSWTRWASIGWLVMPSAQAAFRARRGPA